MKLLLLALLASASAFDWQRYSGYKVYEVVPANNFQLKTLQQLEASSELDFWISPVSVGLPVHILAAPANQQSLLNDFRSLGLRPTVHVQDAGEKLKASWDEITQNGLPGQRAFDYNNWNTFDEFMAELDSLAASCPAGFTCVVSQIGTTYEGRPIKVLKVSNGTPRRAFWVDSQVHAREWLAGATVMNVMNNLIRNYGSDADATAMMDAFDWYFVPVMNPDGYVYTWTNDRYWRKNRTPNSGSPCLGTDLNRNYPFGWGNNGASPLPCSDTYRGEGSASELETQAIVSYGSSVAGDLNGWLSVHTYGQYILYPYGDCSLPSDNADQVRNVNLMCTAIEDTYNTRWDCGNSCSVLYETSGGTNDWAKGVVNVKYAYVPELRGNDFVVAVSQIQPSYNEFWNGVVAFVNDAAANQ